MRTHTCACARAMHTHMHTLHACTHGTHKHAQIHARTRTCTHEHAQSQHACKYTPTHYTHACMYLFTHTRTHAHAHTRTHTHTHTHTQTGSSVEGVGEEEGSRDSDRVCRHLPVCFCLFGQAQLPDLLFFVYKWGTQSKLFKSYEMTPLVTYTPPC